MRRTMLSPRVAPLVCLVCALGLAAYFAFAALQGAHGRLRRAELETQAAALRVEAAELKGQIAMMENRTRRLSDDYLDLDLLDERARKVLGLVRADEIVIR